MENKEKVGIEEYNKIINPKSLIISGDVHKQLKDYVKSKGLKISFFIEQLFLTHKNKENESK